MKKKIAAALAAAFVLTTAGSVLAAPIEYDGKITFQTRKQTMDNTPDNVNNIWKLVINGKAPGFTDNMDFYFRVGGEYYNDPNGSGRDFASFPGQTDTKQNAFALDQFGVNIKSGGWTYTLGRQATTVGATALLYNDNFKVGKHVFSDGLTIAGKSGVTDIVIAARQLDVYGGADHKVYVGAASYKPSKDLTLGATVAKFDSADAAVNSSNHWAVNTSYNMSDTVNVFAEYTKSNADANNKAYVFGGSYAFDKKNTFWAAYQRVEKFGDIAQGTDWDNNAKGMYYGLSHQFDKTTSLDFFYKSMKTLDTTPVKYTSLRATVGYKF